MRSLIILISFLSSMSGFAQDNLVLNAGFEQGDAGTDGFNEIRSAGYLLDHWYSPVRKQSPQYYVQPRRSIAKAKSGKGAVGLVLGGVRQEKTKVEYLTGELKETLKKNQVYCVCFYGLLHRTSRWAATDVGIIFHHDQTLISNLPEPQTYQANLYIDEGKPITGSKWKKYCGYYMASGGEKFLSIGKFGKSESVRASDLGIDPYFEIDAFQSKAYYQFDDFSVKAISSSTDCDCAKEMPEVKTEEKTIVAPPLMIALDVSGSMKTNSLFDSLRKNLMSLVSRLPHGSPLSVITFSSSSRDLFKGVVNEHTSQTVDSLLALVKLGGGTNVFSGLDRSYKSIETEGLDSAKLVLISDGAFSITTKIASLVKEQYEVHGRRLSIIQIEKKISGFERIEPYETEYVYTTMSELSQAVFSVYQPMGNLGLIASCECSESFSDTMNYHFIVDYSGSMRSEKGRAIRSVEYLFERAPAGAAISITVFNSSAKEIYRGKKADITIDRLSEILKAQRTGGGTNPSPGVRRSIEIAREMEENRFSHLILITDISAGGLTRLTELNTELAKVKDMYLAVSAMQVDKAGFLMDHAQYDFTTTQFLDVSQQKFETDLFHTERSSCDFTSQAYHFNPVKDMLKEGLKKQGRSLLEGILEQGLQLPR